MFPKFQPRLIGAALAAVALVSWLLFLHGTRNVAPRPPPRPQHAYVFYATANTYACSALVNARRLRLLHSTLPIFLLASPGVRPTALAAIRSSPLGITVVEDTAPPLGPNSVAYYAEVLLKLRALRLHHVDPALSRVVILDSDQLVRRNLDHLFLLPAVDLAAPLMYWGGDRRGVTTTLMVGALNDELWKIVDNAMHHMRPDEYDMDLVNHVLGQRTMVLPGRYCALNSHWEANDVPGWFRGTKTVKNATSEEMVELYDAIEVLHFTAMEKPWNVNTDTVMELKPDVHPLFVEQFREWQQLAKEVCGDFWEFVPPVPQDVAMLND